MSQPPASPLYTFLRQSRPPSTMAPPSSQSQHSNANSSDSQLSAKLLLASSESASSLSRVEGRLETISTTCSSTADSLRQTIDRVETTIKDFSTTTASTLNDGIQASLTTLIAPELAALRIQSDALRSSAVQLQSSTKIEVERVIARQDKLDAAVLLLSQQVQTLSAGLQPLIILAPLLTHFIQHLDDHPATSRSARQSTPPPRQPSTPPPSPEPRITPSYRPPKRRRLIDSDGEGS